MKHLEFDKPVAGKEFKNSLFLVQDERFRNVVRVLVLALDFFFLNDFGEDFFQGPALVIFSKFRVFKNVLEANRVADGSQVPLQLQFPHEVELFSDKLVVDQFGVEQLNVLFDELLGELDVELIFQSDSFQVDFTFDQQRLSDIFENGDEMFFAEQKVVMPINFSKASGLVDAGRLGGMFGEYFDDSTLNGIESDVEDLRQDPDVDMSSFQDKVKYLLVKFLRSDVLITVTGGVEPETRVMQFDHDFSDGSFSERVGFLFLH